MRIIIEIDEQRMPGAPSEATIARTASASAADTTATQAQTAASGQTSALDAGIAAPLAENAASGSGQEPTSPTPAGQTTDALSAGAAPEQDMTP